MEQLWDNMFIECNFADLGHILYTGWTEFHMFFLTKLNCLHKFQVDILSNKEAILWKCTLKELRSKLQLHWKCAVLQMFF